MFLWLNIWASLYKIMSVQSLAMWSCYNNNYWKWKCFLCSLKIWSSVKNTQVQYENLKPSMHVHPQWTLQWSNNVWKFVYVCLIVFYQIWYFFPTYMSECLLHPWRVTDNDPWRKSSAFCFYNCLVRLNSGHRVHLFCIGGTSGVRNETLGPPIHNL